MTKRFATVMILNVVALSCTSGTPPADSPSPVGPKFVAFREPRLVMDRLGVPISPPYSAGSSPAQFQVESSNPSVVTIDELGNLVAHQNGTAVISARSGSQLRVEVISAHSLSAVPARLVLLLGGKHRLQINDGGKQLRADALRWTTTDPSIAAVFGDTVQAGAKIGTATITGSVGDSQVSLQVTVQAGPSEKLVIAPASATVHAGSILQLSLEVPSASPVVWESSDSTILQPLRSGAFYGTRVGVALGCAVVGSSKTCSTVRIVK